MCIKINEIIEEGAYIDAPTLAARALVTHSIDLRQVKGGFKRFTKASFFSCFCLTSYNKSAEFKRIRFNKSNILIGWVIPSLYFSEPQLFYHERYLADFAYAAFLKSLSGEIEGINALVNQITATEANESIGFSELIPEHVSFAVFSKDCVKKSKISLVEIELSLLKGDIHIIRNDSEFAHKESLNKLTLKEIKNQINQSKITKDIHVSKLPKTCANVEILIQEVLAMATQEMTGVGGFLCLYQVLEYLMEDMFSVMVYGASQSNTSAWKLKSDLSEATSESKRLRKIAERAQKNGANPKLFDELKEMCKLFLGDCKLDVEPKEKIWIDYVYACRNTLIHNQLLAHRVGAFKHILPLNICMRRAVLELSFSY